MEQAKLHAKCSVHVLYSGFMLLNRVSAFWLV